MKEKKYIIYKLVNLITNIPNLLFMWVTFPVVATVMFFVTDWEDEWDRKKYKSEAIKWLKGKTK